MGDAASNPTESTAKKLPVEAQLCADQPIRSIKDDLLGRGDFALAMANALSGWRGDESLVLALYGPWGSGKSSVKNLILEFLEGADNPLTVMHFNPWAWSGQDALFAAFFKEIGVVIGHRAKGKERKEAASKWKTYASRLALGGTVLKHLKTATQIVGVPVAPAVLEMLSDAADKTSEVVKQGAEADEGEDEEPLDAIKESLAESLRKLEQPVLVVVDDVDRLTNDEIRLLFRIVKANADFPNIIFLLLFDRSVVEKALESISGINGRHYMEKIVQAGFDLPAVPREDIDDAFAKGLEKALEAFEGWEGQFDKDRWVQMFGHSIQPFLETMRDVRRFLSGFSFTAGMFAHDGCMEINLVDLIAIELLRMFEPEVYHQIPNFRDVLVKEPAMAFASRDDGKVRKEKFEVLVANGSEKRREAVRHMLDLLFPTVNRNYGDGFLQEWIRSLRICTSETFARYFVLAIPKADIPLSLMQTLIKSCESFQEIKKYLSGLHANRMLVPVLRRMEAYTSKFDKSLVENFVTALWDVGEDLSEDAPGMFQISPAMLAHRVVYQCLNRIPDVAGRGRIVLSALKTTTGIHLPVCYVRIEASRKEKSDGIEEILIADDDVNLAKQLCIEKIKAAALTDGLLNENMSIYLRIWKVWDDGDALKQFVSQIVSSTEGSLLFLRGFLSQIQSSGMGSGITKTRWELYGKSIEPFTDFETLEKALKPLLVETVPAELSTLAAAFALELGAFRRALRRKAEGKSDEDIRFGSEDD